MTGAGLVAFGQSSESQPKFDATDVHVSAKTPNQFVRTGPVRDGPYEVTSASMVDLIRIAYGFDTDKILAGSSWLELDRFDVTGKLPANSTPESQKLMLQSVLADRFQLVLHKDTKPLPTYALVAGKKPQLKEAAGSEDTGCHPQASFGAPGEGGGRLMMSGPTGVVTAISLGPGMTVQYNCRNMLVDRREDRDPFGALAHARSSARQRRRSSAGKLAVGRGSGWRIYDLRGSGETTWPEARKAEEVDARHRDRPYRTEAYRELGTFSPSRKLSWIADFIERPVWLCACLYQTEGYSIK